MIFSHVDDLFSDGPTVEVVDRLEELPSENEASGSEDGSPELTSQSLGAITYGQGWPNGVVPYVVDSNVPVGASVQSAMATMESQTALRFDNLVPHIRYSFDTGIGSSFGAYDYSSIMHYGSYAGPGFALDPRRPVMLHIDGTVLPWNQSLSAGDIAAINAFNPAGPSEGESEEPQVSSCNAKCHLYGTEPSCVDHGLATGQCHSSGGWQCIGACLRYTGCSAG